MQRFDAELYAQGSCIGYFSAVRAESLLTGKTLSVWRVFLSRKLLLSSAHRRRMGWWRGGGRTWILSSSCCDLHFFNHGTICHEYPFFEFQLFAATKLWSAGFAQNASVLALGQLVQPVQTTAALMRRQPFRRYRLLFSFFTGVYTLLAGRSCRCPHDISRFLQMIHGFA